MQMSGIWICWAYTQSLHFSHQIRKDAELDLLSTSPAHSGQETQDVAVFSAGDDAICCAPPLLRDPARRDRKQRFAYSLTVVHFRKVSDTQKTGSPENRHPVIYPRGYMAAYYLVGDFCITLKMRQ